MLQDIQIETYLFKMKQLLLLAIGLVIVMFFGMMSSALIARAEKSFILVWIGLAVFVIFPFLFIKRIFRIFAKKVILTLTTEFIRIDIIEKRTNEVTEQLTYFFEEIKAFKITEASSSDSSNIKLILKNKTKVSYAFLEQYNNDKNVLKNICNYFKSFNQVKNSTDRIIYLPTFLASKAGKVSMVIFAIMICISILLHVFYNPSASLSSLFMGALCYVSAKATQTRDIQLYKEFTKATASINYEGK